MVARFSKLTLNHYRCGKPLVENVVPWKHFLEFYLDFIFIFVFMEIPTISGILRRSLGLRCDSGRNDESCQTSPPFHDKATVVRFVDENKYVDEMNCRLLNAPGEKVRFSYDRGDIDSIVHEEDDEDYSASVSAILQRRASSKRSKRRSSSPFSHEEFSAPSSPRRRSSAFTTSSETAITIDDVDIKEEQIYENIRLHKEVIANVKQQPWPVRRKLKLIQQAKSYVKRHEGELQVRLKQSRSTKDILTRFNIVLIKKWQHTKREVINFMNLLIPWELRIKEIESHFGTVVASYFTFLRWLFWVNLVISVILTAFVIVPEVLLNKNRKGEDRKPVLDDEKHITLDTILNFEGRLKYSPIFYGYYLNREEKREYNIPTAYFMIGIGVYIYSFIATLRKMAINFRLSKLSEKEDECIFTWKLFTGWDYMIGNAETSHNRTSSIVLGFKEALLEEAEKKKEKRSWKIITARVFVNINVLWMLIFSASAVVYVVNKTGVLQTKEEEKDESFILKWWHQNETTVVMTVIGSIFPFIFEMFGFIEKYHPRKTLRIQLGRIMALNLLNLYTLTFALFSQIDKMTIDLEVIRSNLTNMTLKPEHFPVTVPAPHIIMKDDNTLKSPPVFAQVLESLHSSTNVPAEYPSHTADMHIQTEAITYLPTSKDKPLSLSLKDNFLKNIKPLKDPATGKYNKTLLNVTEFPRSRSAYPTEFGKFPLASALSDIQNQTWTDSDTSDTFSFNENVSYYGTETDILFQYSVSYMQENETEPDGSFWMDTFSNTTEELFTDTLSNVNVSENEITMSSETYTDVSINSTFATFQTESPISKEQSSVNTDFTTNAFVLFSTTENVTNSFADNNPINNTQIGDNSSISENIAVTTTATTRTETKNSAKTEVAVCPSIPNFADEVYSEVKLKELSEKSKHLSLERRVKLRKLCWETMFGQELVKLTVMDLVSNIISTFFGDFIRAILVRYMNKFWCWDLEKKFPKYADFKIAENILHLVNNQGLVWMGMFFSPGLPLINVVKLMLMMYLRSWAVLTCNVPHEVVFRASRSNNFYLALLLTMLFLCVLPVCYAIVRLKPSWHCGPFSNYPRIYLIFAKTVKNTVPADFHKFMDYMATPGTVIPLIIVLLLVIYYLASLTSALREANIDLKIQLRRERTEERKKMFQMASRRKRGGSDMDSTFAKWKKILQEVPSSKLSDESQIPDYLDDQKKDDTDVDNGYLKHDDEDLQKVRKVFKMKHKTESVNERKWGSLLKMVPKATKEAKSKDSQMRKSIDAESSLMSENVPEIKLSRDQASGNLPSRLKNTSKISELNEKTDSKTPKRSSFVDKWRQKTNRNAEVDIKNVESNQEDDSVFLESVTIDSPELCKIPESISNRIKRRLMKVISMGSSSENQFYSEMGGKELAKGRLHLQDIEKSGSADTVSLHSWNEIQPESFSERIYSCKIMKSRSLNLTSDQWKIGDYLRKKSLSLNAIEVYSHEHNGKHF